MFGIFQASQPTPQVPLQICRAVLKAHAEISALQKFWLAGLFAKTSISPSNRHSKLDFSPTYNAVNPG